MKKIFWPYFLVVSNMTNIKEQFIKVHKFFDNHCGSYKINSLGPKRLLKTQIFGKKCKISCEEKILAYFPRIIERAKPLGTICKVPKGNLPNYCGSSKILSVTARGCGKLKFLKKNQPFQ